MSQQGAGKKKKFKKIIGLPYKNNLEEAFRHHPV
jgi:hypothetical protein